MGIVINLRLHWEDHLANVAHTIFVFGMQPSYISCQDKNKFWMLINKLLYAVSNLKIYEGPNRSYAKNKLISEVLGHLLPPIPDFGFPLKIDLFQRILKNKSFKK